MSTLQQPAVGVHAPVEADVGAAVGVWRQRPDPGAAQVAVRLALEHVRALGATVRVRVCRW